jgi:hypothetical protein
MQSCYLCGRARWISAPQLTRRGERTVVENTASGVALVRTPPGWPNSGALLHLVRRQDGKAIPRPRARRGPCVDGGLAAIRLGARPKRREVPMPQRTGSPFVAPDASGRMRCDTASRSRCRGRAADTCTVGGDHRGSTSGALPEPPRGWRRRRSSAAQHARQGPIGSWRRGVPVGYGAALGSPGMRRPRTRGAGRDARG